MRLRMGESMTPSRLLEAADDLENEGFIDAAALLREAHAVLKEIASSYRDDGTEQDGNCYIDDKTGARLRSMVGDG
jgi:hypothetical protein